MTETTARKSAHKERTRTRILDEAAKALRVEGVEGISVAALMKRAGLTHGGFYAHFASRDDLVAHAIDRMFEDSARLRQIYLDPHPDGSGLAGYIKAYLSERTLLSPEQGCPLPALSGEARRMPPAARQRFEKGVETLRGTIARALAAIGKPEPEALAAGVLAQLVGTLALARSLSDPATALELLETSRQNLLKQLDLG